MSFHPLPVLLPFSSSSRRHGLNPTFLYSWLLNALNNVVLTVCGMALTVWTPFADDMMRSREYTQKNTAAVPCISEQRSVVRPVHFGRFVLRHSREDRYYRRVLRANTAPRRDLRHSVSEYDKTCASLRNSEVSLGRYGISSYKQRRYQLRLSH
jgi:hypothetical protein